MFPNYDQYYPDPESEIMFCDCGKKRPECSTFIETGRDCQGMVILFIQSKDYVNTYQNSEPTNSSILNSPKLLKLKNSIGLSKLSKKLISPIIDEFNTCQILKPINIAKSNSPKLPKKNISPRTEEDSRRELLTCNHLKKKELIQKQQEELIV